MLRSAIRIGVVLLLAATGTVIAGRLVAPPAIRTIPLAGHPLGIAVDPGTGHGFVVRNLDRTVSMIDVETGAALRTVPLEPPGSRYGTGARWVVIDTQAQRAFAGACCVAAGGGPAGTVGVLDTGSGALLRTAVVGGNPVGAVVSETTGRVFVANFDSGTVSVLAAGSGALLRTVALGNSPVALALSASTGHVFVADAEAVSMLDARTGALLRTTPLDQTPWGIAAAERTRRVFVLNHGSVSMLDARTGALLRTVSVAVGTLFSGSDNSEGSGGLGRTPIAVDERTDRVFIAGANLDQGQIAMLDAATGAVLQLRATDALPIGLEVDAGSGRVLVGALIDHDPAGNPIGPGGVLVLDGRSAAIQRTVEVGIGPYTIAVAARHAYVVDMDSNPDGSTVLAAEARRDWRATWGSLLPAWLPLARPAARQVSGDIRVLDLARL